MRENNYGLKTRDMFKAASFAMNREVANGNASFSTAATISERFRKFSNFANEKGLRRLEEITPTLVSTYGQGLAQQVEIGELSIAYAQNLVSAVNTVMTAATLGNWKSVSPTRTCKIPHRSHVRETKAASTDQSLVESAMATMSERGRAIASMARSFGLRSKEASLINPRSALEEAKQTAQVTIIAGTKGGRKRIVPITNERQIASLILASEVQDGNRSLTPENETWSEFRERELREIREILRAHGMTGLHDLRAGYATERYQNLTGERIPIDGGSASKEDDLVAREIIAVELGHGRIDVVNAYIGNRRK